MFDLIGSSTRFRALLEDVAIVAPVNTAVLIQGETGTGKEMIARAIHEAGPRQSQRFVALNCAAIPGALLESELFGHEKGAFTGAVAPAIGRFHAADRGTLFLDEIGELSLELQPKLLRALQEKEFERLGSAHTHHVDVRVIAATNQDLGRMVQERKFRPDLYYRLNVFPITLPPLRERRSDIRLLALHFVHRFAKEQGKVINMIPEDVLTALERHNWPGNIRELQNVIERGVIRTSGPVLSRQTTEHLIQSDAVQRPMNADVALVSIKTMAEAERAHITATLRETNGVIGGPHGAAAQLGIPRTTLISKMQRLGIPSRSSRGRAGSPSQRPVRSTGGPSSHLKDDSTTPLRFLQSVAG